MVNEETHVKNGVSLTGAATGHAASNGQGSGTGVGGQPGSESSEDEREGRIRVGREYQAVPPPCLPPADRRPDLCPERALLVWSPNHSITTKRLDEFVQVAKDKYSYNVEQALGMLFWHKHDLERAMQDLANFTPFPDEWSVEDKVLFEQAFQFHGKSFHRIRQMLPDKSIAALVKYYYSWKKTRTRTSLMDRQAKKLQAVREEGRYDDLDQFGEGDEDSQGDKEGEKKVENCGNCGIQCHQIHSTPKGNMCGTCHAFWEKTGQLRPTTGPLRKDGLKATRNVFRNSTKPPKGMHINHDDLVALATGPNGQGEVVLKSLDTEILDSKRSVQNNKQLLATLRRRTRGCEIEPYRIPEPSATRINARWSNEEHLLAVQGIRKFGKDFKSIAEILGTKSETHVRGFFVNYKRRFNLDSVLKEYEDEFGPQGGDEDKMDVDKDGVENGENGSTPRGLGTPKGSGTPSNGSPRSKSPAIKANGK
eukprot:TRINITY_DN1251_c0_g1_i10.p1 TRINITY_DN1251_c0_g1~~TRINITY_DN1251_c0_g1_i10.p1  ORF type:complete len:479 (-),score=95.51 TRINITY_DN1251_c0_g1_i10:1207-2643(-)